ncbi:ORF6N domain-containing protein [Agriterribacter sp.]|uniref:ORF6N domain-containing protein n=1 Tax=Agriterribacter sp. TaxID=2821509 RepID=UPI002B84399A|nr:ORF6N domain-containing protein [Agriterribacter sp.]HRO45648.1 ORF6N domain-containing protein [Agriterribacter sp.]HRQ17469.1 ORF6N domain-containing protein [Agriterribacter sp.]
MKAQNQLPEVTTDEIVEKIYVVRGVKVMLDKDLAEMYGVETRVLNQAVQRNLARFPYDFMFQLTEDEFKNLISQFVISSWGGTRKMPYAFTEHGVAMLSSVLRSEQAIQVNIRIVRVYTRMRQLILDNKELWLKIEKIEQSLAKKDDEVQAIFKVLKNLLVKEEKPRQPIGFKIPGKK